MLRLPSPKTLWTLAKKVESLLELEERQSKAIAEIQSQVNKLADRVTRLEAREDVVIAEAKGAAAAAMTAASASMADIARRVGSLKERARGSGASPRLTDQQDSAV